MLIRIEWGGTWVSMVIVEWGGKTLGTFHAAVDIYKVVVEHGDLLTAEIRGDFAYRWREC